MSLGTTRYDERPGSAFFLLTMSVSACTYAQIRTDQPTNPCSMLPDSTPAMPHHHYYSASKRHTDLGPFFFTRVIITMPVAAKR